jgi:Zn-dependent metalloprotease
VSATDGTVLSVGDGGLHAFAEAKSVRNYIDGRFSAKGHTLNVGYELTEGNTVHDDKYSLIRAGDSNTTRIVTYGHKGFSEDKTASSLPIVKDSFQEFDADGSKEQAYLGAGKGAAVDAHHWISAADSWYSRTFGEPLGRPDPSGKVRGNVLNIVVHRNDNKPNDGASRYEAAYVPGANAIYFGDGGIGKPTGEGDRMPIPFPGRTVHPFAIAPDVAGHEAGHIILARRGLQARGEAGVIHEGLSDVMGKLFELSELKRIQRPDLVGYEMFEDGRGLRNLARPSRVDGAFGYKAADAMGTAAYECPDNRDKGCVHSRATVIGHAFYLMTFGGRNESTGILIPKGVGLEIATSLWTALLPKPPAGAPAGYVPPTIEDIAKRQLAHALRIYGASVLAGKAGLPYQVAAVACAWEAVGVLKPGHVLGITGVPSLCLRASSSQSCVGRLDGTYCDPEHPYSNVTCRNGGIAGALPQCATNKRCVSAGFDYQDKAVVRDGAVVCE